MPAARAGVPLIECFFRLPSRPVARSAGRAGRKRDPLPGPLAALPAGVPDGIHVRPGDLAAGRLSAARSVDASFLGDNYLTVVSVYSLLLLSEVVLLEFVRLRPLRGADLFSGAGAVFARADRQEPERAVFSSLLEILAVTAVCALLGMPLNPLKLAEAFAVAAVVSIFLLGAGNLLSVHQARGVNPDSSFRSGAAGRVQAMLLVIYPIAFVPAGWRTWRATR